jgi:hypothetical protein
MAEPIPFAAAVPDMPPLAPESTGGGGQPTRITVAPNAPVPFNNAVPDAPAETSDQTPAEPAPTNNAGTNTMTDIENMMSAAMQGTTPDVSLHTPNYLGDAWNINDGGEVLSYKDKDGEEHPTDSSKMVALRDPETGKYQVFNRTDETNEEGLKGKVLALGRYLNFFNATGATPGGNLGVPIKGSGQFAAAAQRQGVNVAKGITTPYTGVQSRAILASKVPWVGSALSENASKFAPQLEGKAEGIAEKLSPGGVVQTPAEAGTAVQKGVSNWTNVESKTPVDAAYDAVDKLVDQTKKQRLDNTWDVVSKIQKKYKDANILGKSPALKEIIPTLKKPGGLDYQTLKFVRTRIGKLIQNPGELKGGITDQELGQIYGGLTDDLGKLVNKAGQPGAVNAWKRAGQLAKATNARRELLNDTFGNTSKSDEGLFKQVIRYAGNGASANMKALAAAKKAIPAADWKELGASVISKLGRTDTAQGSQLFDPAKFAKDYNSLSEEGKSILFGAKGSDYRQSLDDIAYLSSKGKDVAKMSGAAKGHGNVGIGTLAALEGLREVKEMLPGSGIIHTIIAGMGALGGKHYANMLAKPASARAISKWLTAYKNVKGIGGGSNALAALHNTSQVLGSEMEAENKTGNPNAYVKYLEAIAQVPVSGIDAAIGK